MEKELLTEEQKNKITAACKEIFHILKRYDLNATELYGLFGAMIATVFDEPVEVTIELVKMFSANRQELSEVKKKIFETLLNAAKNGGKDVTAH